MSSFSKILFPEPRKPSVSVQEALVNLGILIVHCLIWLSFICHVPRLPRYVPWLSLGKLCAQVGVSAWSSLCRSLFPHSHWQAVNASLNKRCLPSLCLSSPCWILIQELSGTTLETQNQFDLAVCSNSKWWAPIKGKSCFKSESQAR